MIVSGDCMPASLQRHKMRVTLVYANALIHIFSIILTCLGVFSSVTLWTKLCLHEHKRQLAYF